MCHPINVIQNKICFNHPLQLSIALTYLAGEDDAGNPTYVDFNNIKPVFHFWNVRPLKKSDRRIIFWGTPRNAYDVKIDTDNHTISFKTDVGCPVGIVDELHQKLPGGWVWKFASESPGFILGYYETNGRERIYHDLSDDYIDIIPEAINLYHELWNNQTTERKEETE